MEYISRHHTWHITNGISITKHGIWHSICGISISVHGTWLWKHVTWNTTFEITIFKQKTWTYKHGNNIVCHLNLYAWNLELQAENTDPICVESQYPKVETEWQSQALSLLVRRHKIHHGTWCFMLGFQTTNKELGLTCEEPYTPRYGNLNFNNRLKLA